MKRAIDHTTTQYDTLLEWRESVNLTQLEASRLFGVSQAAYNRWENHIHAVNRNRVRKVAEKTGVPLEKLLLVA